MLLALIEKRNAKRSVIALLSAALLILAIALFNRLTAFLMVVSLVNDEVAVVSWALANARPGTIILACGVASFLRNTWLFFSLKLDERNEVEQKLGKWQYRVLYATARKLPGAILVFCGFAPSFLCSLPVVVFLMKIMEKYGLGIKKQDAVLLLWFGGLMRIVLMATNPLTVVLARDLANLLRQLVRFLGVQL